MRIIMTSAYRLAIRYLKQRRRLLVENGVRAKFTNCACVCCGDIPLPRRCYFSFNLICRRRRCEENVSLFCYKLKYFAVIPLKFIIKRYSVRIFNKIEGNLLLFLLFRAFTKTSQGWSNNNPRATQAKPTKYKKSKLNVFNYITSENECSYTV